MTAIGGAPRRVLVVWCPAWPGQDAGGAGRAGEAESDTRAFEQVGAVVEGFCPRGEVLYPGVCAFGARGPARYFGGEGPPATKSIETGARRAFACQDCAAECRSA